MNISPEHKELQAFSRMAKQEIDTANIFMWKIWYQYGVRKNVVKFALSGGASPGSSTSKKVIGIITPIAKSFFKDRLIEVYGEYGAYPSTSSVKVEVRK